jgi:hypothetical protein
VKKREGTHRVQSVRYLKGVTAKLTRSMGRVVIMVQLVNGEKVVPLKNVLHLERGVRDSVGV